MIEQVVVTAFRLRCDACGEVVSDLMLRVADIYAYADKPGADIRHCAAGADLCKRCRCWSCNGIGREIKSCEDPGHGHGDYWSAVLCLGKAAHGVCHVCDGLGGKR